jgi:serine phosphatase RsbU (regulator of sigma subunit)
MGQLPSNLVTADFRDSFEAETRTLMRRRFLWFSGSIATLGLLTIVAVIVIAVLFHSIGRMGGLPTANPIAGDVAAAGAAPDLASGRLFGLRTKDVTGIGLGLLSTIGFVATFLYVRSKRPSADLILRVSFWLIIGDGLIHILGKWFDLGGFGMWGVLLSHVIACCFLPWNAAQALRPFLILFGIDALLTLTLGLTRELPGSLPRQLVFIGFGALAGVPGTMICWLRNTRRFEQYKVQFLQQRYGEVRRELVDARRIHESLFPAPFADESIGLRYVYEPMRQIGGDYLFAHRQPDQFGGGGVLNVVLLDVTGHGIAAALTVNRLYGELQRVFAENPGATPGQVLSLLNRYVHLTLADHSVFATALCLRIDIDRNTLQVANGGHPPAFVVASDRTVHELNSTAFVLGACGDSDFEHGEFSVEFRAGDSLVAYTDGAIEARNADGKMLGIRAIQSMLASREPRPTLDVSSELLRMVERWRSRPPTDDTLVIEISRPAAPATGAQVATPAR